MMTLSAVLLVVSFCNGQTQVLAKFNFTAAIGEVFTDSSGNNMPLVAGDDLTVEHDSRPMSTANGVYFRSATILQFPPNAVRLAFVGLTDHFHLKAWIYPEVFGRFFNLDNLFVVSFGPESVTASVNSSFTVTHTLHGSGERWVYLAIEVSINSISLWEDDTSPVVLTLPAILFQANYKFMQLGGGFVGYIYELEVARGSFDGIVPYVSCDVCVCRGSECTSICPDLMGEASCGFLPSRRILAAEPDPCTSACITCSGCDSCYEQTCLDIATEYCSSSSFDGSSCNWTNCEVEGCELCETTSECFACSDGYALLEDTKECVSGECPSGYYLEPSVYALCQLCHTTCLTCTGPEETDCSSCGDGLFFSGSSCFQCLEHCTTCTVNNTCASCESGFYFVNSTQTCSSCSTECITCTSATECTECVSEYYLNSGSCLQCPEHCLNCSSLTTCSDCHDGFILTAADTCECTEYYSYNSGSSSCELDLLSAVATIEDEWIEIVFSRAPITPPTASNIHECYFLPNNVIAQPTIVALTSETYSITLTIEHIPEEVESLTIQFINLQQEDGATTEDIEVVIRGVRIDFLPVTEETNPECPEYYSYNSETSSCELDPLSAVATIEAEWIEIVFSRVPMTPPTASNIHECYFLPNHVSALPIVGTVTPEISNITLIINQIPEQVTNLTLRFTNLQQEAGTTPEDVEVVVIGDRTDFLKVTEESISSSESTEEPDSEQKSTVEPYLQSVAKDGGPSLSFSFGLAAGILSLSFSDLSSLWTFVHAAQILYFMPVQQVNVSSSVRTIWLSFGSQLFELPNIGEWTDDGDTPSPEEWHAVEFPSTNFAVNTGEILFVVLVTFLLLPVFAMGFYTCRRCSKLSNFFKQRVGDYKWCFFIRVGLEVYLEFVIAAMIAIGNEDTSLLWLGVSILVLGSAVIAIPLICWFLTKKRQLIYDEDKVFQKKYGSLFEEFKSTPPVMNLMFYPLFCLRRLVYVVSLYFLGEWPISQILVNLAGTAVVLVHLRVYKPFKEVVVQKITVASEIVIFINFLSTAAFLAESTVLHDCAAILICTAIVTLVLTAYYFICKGLCNSLKNCYKKRGNQTVSPAQNNDKGCSASVRTYQLTESARDSEFQADLHCSNHDPENDSPVFRRVFQPTESA